MHGKSVVWTCPAPNWHCVLLVRTPATDSGLAAQLEGQGRRVTAFLCGLTGQTGKRNSGKPGSDIRDEKRKAVKQ